ncbi:UBR7 (predicted) [Pycnogonum litorale]
MDVKDKGDVENENTVTMVDVLEEEQELENDANAVLGASDDKNCTYLQGYVKRQALYACKTCSTLDVPAGICLACSYACHEGHDLIELYTRRCFRCDCGNEKFVSNSCKLLNEKSLINVDNSYNHNFSGKYCICSRPYPDPDDDVSDEMIQCVLCEDWFHGRHINTSIPDNEDYGEMTCSSCMSQHDFLRLYYLSITATKVKSSNENSIPKIENDRQCIEKVDDHPNPEKLMLKEDSDEVTSIKSDGKDERRECFLSKLKSTTDGQDVNKLSDRAAFWSYNWRQKLCTCSECKKLYEDHKITFLLDPEDTVHAYEEQGKSSQTNSTQYDRGMSALKKMDRVKQVEAIHGYNQMKTALKDYLKKFADNGKVVKEEDIREFFDGMQSQKRQKVANTIPYYCK